ncbi:hypothetical protein DFAR_3460008 [Desulfarculales bacterium]
MGRNNRGGSRALDEDTAQALVRLRRELPIIYRRCTRPCSNGGYTVQPSGSHHAGKTVTGAEPGYARNPGKPLWPRRYHRRRPNVRGSVARNHQQVHSDRCHP